MSGDLEFDPDVLRKLLRFGGYAPAALALLIGIGTANLLLASISALAIMALATGERWISTRPASAPAALAVIILAVVAVLLPFYGGLNGPLLATLVSPVVLANLSKDRRISRSVTALALGLVTAYACVDAVGWPMAQHQTTSLNAIIHIVVIATVSAFTEHTFQRYRTAIEHRAEQEAIAKAAVAERDQELIRRRTAEEQLNEAVRQAEEASSAKSSFLASMSHELRTPLNAIIGYAEMLVEEEDDPENSADLQRIELAGQHLLTLINDVLDLSKIEAGRMSLDPQRLAVERLVDEVEQAVTPQVLAGKNTFEVVDESGVTHFTADPIRVKQVLINLLANAAKFTHEGRIVLRLATDHRAGTEMLTFTVEDDGIGIDPADLSRLFRPFEQAHAQGDARKKGTGLGLALSRNLAHMMEGDIQADSEPGRGSRFTFMLPVQAPILQLRDQQERRAELAASSPSPVVVCVDDRSSDLLLQDRRFTQEGFFVVPCTDSRDALLPSLHRMTGIWSRSASRRMAARSSRPPRWTMCRSMVRRAGRTARTSSRASPRSRGWPAW